MSTLSTTNVHDVVAIQVEPVHTVGTVRWQDIIFQLKGGSEVRVSAFLNPGYAGYAAFARNEDTPGRRNEDVPRQLDLPFDLPPLA